MFAARTTHSYTNQISATLYLFPCVHMHLTCPFSPVPALVVPDSRTSRVPIASRLPAHLRNLSSSLAPAPRVVFVPSPASCLVLSLRRHSNNASDVQVRALRGPGSSSSLIALFSDWGFYACHSGLLLLVQYTIFRSHCASLCKPRLDSEPRVWPSSSSARSCAPSTRPFFWCSTWARTAGESGGAAAPPALKARKPTFDRAPWTYPRTFRLLHTLFRGGSLCRVLHLIYLHTQVQSKTEKLNEIDLMRMGMQ